MVETFTAQLQIVGWLLDKKYVTLKELATKDRPTYNRFFKNIVFFLNEIQQKVEHALGFVDAMVRMEGVRLEEA